MALQVATRRNIISFLGVIFLFLGMAEMIPGTREALGDQNGDLSRQWVVTQYVIRRENPYPIALEALLARYGALAPHGPIHLQDTKVFKIPVSGPHPQTDATMGPPEATYPPSTLMALVPLGLLPRETAAQSWLLLNLALVLLLGWELKALAQAEEVSLLSFLGLVAIWPAVAICVGREQFSLLCLYCILLAHRINSRHPIIAGLLYSLSLVKPSLAMPFFALPLLETSTGLPNKARTLVSLGMSQLMLVGAISWIVRENPGVLIIGWLRVAGYFRQGMYTVQELINRLRIDGSVCDFALQLLILLGGIILAYRSSGAKRLSILGIVSCGWTYHGSYDFVMLLIPASLLTVASIGRRWFIELTALTIVGIALTAPVYGGTSKVSRVVRNAARLSMLVLLVGAAVPSQPGMQLPDRVSWKRD
jgi:hypothetical protein